MAMGMLLLSLSLGLVTLGLYRIALWFVADRGRQALSAYRAHCLVTAARGSVASSAPAFRTASVVASRLSPLPLLLPLPFAELPPEAIAVPPHSSPRGCWGLAPNGHDGSPPSAVLPCLVNSAPGPSLTETLAPVALAGLHQVQRQGQTTTHAEPAFLVTQLDSSPGEVQSTLPGELVSVAGDCPLCHRLTVEEPRFGGNHRCIYCGWVEDLI